jgi:hypothetical protein
MGKEILQFVNTIADIVHGCVHEWGGQTNKNLGIVVIVTVINLRCSDPLPSLSSILSLFIYTYINTRKCIRDSMENWR